jgi:RNA polymerase sigma factor (sigma-70 family)
VTAPDIHRAIEAVWRIESPKLIAGLTRMTRDVGVAEDMAQDALLAALEQWAESGVPNNPGAWLMQTAKRRAIDGMRRTSMAEKKHDMIGYELEAQQERAVPDLDAALDDHVGDDLLRLLFISCHPVLARDARVALTLRLLGGLTTDEIARAFVVPEATVAQRIVRAKKTLAEAQVPFEVPRGADLEARIASVLEVIYLVFNEGYSATAGEDLIRPSLCDEAMRLGRVLVGLAPDESEVHGLVALMELQASRARARVDEKGEAVLLMDQDRGKWDHLLIQRGLIALRRAEELGGDGTYAIQAAIAACHARAGVAADTDWSRIAALYERLGRVAPSPIIDLNRAMAVAMSGRVDEGLAIVDGLMANPALKGYHLLPAARGDLLERLGRATEARKEFERAAGMTRNERERSVLLARAARQPQSSER